MLCQIQRRFTGVPFKLHTVIIDFPPARRLTRPYVKFWNSGNILLFLSSTRPRPPAKRDYKNQYCAPGFSADFPEAMAFTSLSTSSIARLGGKVGKRRSRRVNKMQRVFAKPVLGADATLEKSVELIDHVIYDLFHLVHVFREN